MPFDYWVGLCGGGLATAAGTGMLFWPERFYTDEDALPGESGRPPTPSQLRSIRLGGTFLFFCGMGILHAILFGPGAPVEFIGV